MRNEKSTLISQFPYNYTNSLNWEASNTKLSHIRQSSSKSQSISKSFFDKINVSILIPDQETTKIVEDAMISAGANVIVGKPENADIIISQTQIIKTPEINFTPNRKRIPPVATVSAITPKSSKSPNVSGQLILTPSPYNDKAGKKTKSPRNILTSQIPWIYDYEKKNNRANKNSNTNKNSKKTNNNAKIFNTSTINNSSTSISGPLIEAHPPSSNEDLAQNVLIISDISRRFRPTFTIIKQSISIHYGKVPQAYHITPFDPIPPMAKELVEKYKAKLRNNRVTINPQPTNNGYCYICQTPYKDAPTHHCSKSHQNSAYLVNWNEFDQLAFQINSEFLDWTKNQ